LTSGRHFVDLGRAGFGPGLRLARQAIEQLLDLQPIVLDPFAIQIERDAGLVRGESADDNLRRLHLWLARNGDDSDTNVALFAARLLPAPGR
jgi:hypothetical protein